MKPQIQQELQQQYRSRGDQGDTELSFTYPEYWEGPSATDTKKPYADQPTTTSRATAHVSTTTKATRANSLTLDRGQHTGESTTGATLGYQLPTSPKTKGNKTTSGKITCPHNHHSVPAENPGISATTWPSTSQGRYQHHQKEPNEPTGDVPMTLTSTAENWVAGPHSMDPVDNYHENDSCPLN